MPEKESAYDSVGLQLLGCCWDDVACLLLVGNAAMQEVERMWLQVRWGGSRCNDI